MPHFSKRFRHTKTIKKPKRRPFDAENLKPIKQATPLEIFGSAIKIPTKKKSK